MLAIAPTFDGKRTVPSAEVTQLMLEMLDLKPGDKVLEIGTGSGFQTRKLAETGAEIHTIELEPWCDNECLYGWPNVYLHAGDGKIGLEQEAPFTAIIATCGVEDIPEEWKQQLAVGGRLVIPIGDSSSQRLTLYRKTQGKYGDCRVIEPERIGAYVRFQMLRDGHAPHA